MSCYRLTLKNRLDKHCLQQEIKYSWESELSGTGSCTCTCTLVLAKSFEFTFNLIFYLWCGHRTETF